MTVEDFARLQVAKLDLDHGDVLLVKVPDNYSNEQAEFAGNELARHLKEIRARVLLFKGDVQFSVVKDVTR
jgi:hypothetical protein